MKKGQLSRTIMIILFVLAAITLLFIFTPLLDWFMGKSAEEVCRTSVVAASSLRLAGQSFTNINCPATKLTIEENDVSENGAVSLDELKKEFAEQMRICWWKMGEGKLEMFSDENPAGSDSICVVCSKIDVEEEVLDEVVSLDNFPEYLQKHNVSESSDKSYIDYMSVKGENVTFVPNQISLASNNLVIFQFATKGQAASFPVIKVVASLFGEDETVSTIHLRESDDIHELRCDDVYQ